MNSNMNSNVVGSILEGLSEHRVEKLDEGKIKVGDKVQVEGLQEL